MDICDVTAEDLGSYDYIVHFAAESHVDNSIKDGKPFVRTNVEGTFNLLECARQNKDLKKFIHISTDEVYGDMDDICWDAESNETFGLKGSSYYSATKAASDLLVEAAGRTFGLPYLITRTCNNYGSKQNAEKFIPKIMKSIAEDLTIPVYGDGNQIREWIDVEDNTQILYNLMLSEEQGGVYNIGSGERYENIEIINMIGEMLGKKPKFEFVADRLGHDRRYAVDSSKVRGLYPEWINLSFKEFLLEQVYTLKN
jgi:dTDP-glucose 4,6-dehydratase